MKWSRVLTPKPTAVGLFPLYFLTLSSSWGRSVFMVPVAPVTPMRETT